MKTISVLLMTIIWGVLMPGTSYAALSGRVDGKRSHLRQHHNQVSGASHLPSRASLTRANHNAWLARPSTSTRSVPSSLHNVHHRGSNPAVTTGSVSSARRSDGAIGGSRMKRKP